MNRFSNILFIFRGFIVIYLYISKILEFSSGFQNRKIDVTPLGKMGPISGDSAPLGNLRALFPNCFWKLNNWIKNSLFDNKNSLPINEFTYNLTKYPINFYQKNAALLPSG